MTFGDIQPNSEFVNSSIQLLTPGGATAKVTIEGLGTVKAIFSYWEEDDAMDGAGWYLEADEDAEYNQNSRVIPFGDAYCVSRSTSETGAALVYSGEVLTTPVTKTLNAGFNYVGNCCPKDITFGDITPNATFVNSSIQLLTSGGATAKVTVAGLGNVKATFSYWDADDAMDGAGWYLDADEDAEYNQNDRVISSGSAFCVSRSTSEEGATVTIPSAL